MREQLENAVETATHGVGNTSHMIHLKNIHQNTDTNKDVFTGARDSMRNIHLKEKTQQNVSHNAMNDTTCKHLHDSEQTQ